MKMNAYEKYKRELFAQKTPYLQWLKEQETELERRYGQQRNQGFIGKQVYTLPFSSCLEKVQGLAGICADAVYLFAKNGGSLSDYAVAAFAEVFSCDGNVVLAYADEDYRGGLRELYDIEEGAFEQEITEPYCAGVQDKDSGRCAQYRGKPWFKPEFSPDTLASFFYIGSVFAVRGDQILEMMGKYGSSLEIYELVYRIFMEALDRDRQGLAEGIVHIPKVLYTNDSLADVERIDSSEKVRALYRAEQREYGAKHDKISVVIPSRDNASVLQKCLETFVQYTTYDCYEIIIVDNGSSSEQKRRITHIIDAWKKEKTDLAIQYLYRESAFNFSAMCNAGAQSAVGTYLLFLNDDIEIIDTEDGRQWLDRMMVYARKSYVGAVGAKLYYPLGSEADGGYRIQHAGITNMGIGPAHKLGGMVDSGCLYHGHNTQNYDMLAVTAACMLMRKSVFDEIGGFDETFPVAYNDVELCFRLYQRGYFNVQVNEAVLIHHESLSRGQDTSPEKQRRLTDEKRKLYQKHILFNAYDPFYSVNLVQWKKDTEYNTGYLYAFDRQVRAVALEDGGVNEKRKRTIFKRYDRRALLRAKCGLAAKIYDRLTGYHDIMFHIDNIGCGNGIIDDKITDNNLMIEGWCAVKNADNADLPRKLWLIYEVRNFEFRSVYEFDIVPKLREDVAAVLEENGEKSTRNTALSGIQVNIGKNMLKPGTYRIGVVCKDRLICDQEKYVHIPGTDIGDDECHVLYK